MNFLQLHKQKSHLQMEAEIAQQNKIQSSIRQQNHLLQKTASELKDQVANLSIALRELQAEERQLNKEVVHSPDRVKADVHQAEKELEEVKRLIAKKEEERNLLAKMLKNAVKGEESVKSSTETIEDMDDLVQQYEIAAEDADDLSANADKVERSLEKKTTEKEELDIDIRAIGTLLCLHKNS
jgi:kinetochore protein Nuf2